jgi:hypothetical protein
VRVVATNPTASAPSGTVRSVAYRVRTSGGAAFGWGPSVSPSKFETLTQMADNEAVVEGLLRTFVGRLRERNVEGAISLFEHEAVLFGSELGETATGHAELQTFFRRIFARSQTYVGNGNR